MRTYLTSILAAGAIWFGANVIGTAIADDNLREPQAAQTGTIDDKATVPSEKGQETGTVAADETPANQDGTMTAEYNVNEIVSALKGSGECYKVYTAKFKTAKGEQTLVVCDEMVGDQLVPKYRINVEDICDVSLHENSGFMYVFEWMIGDDVTVRTKHGVVYTMRLWDSDAEKVYTALKGYASTNNAKCENE